MLRSKAPLAAAGVLFAGGIISFLALTSPPPAPSQPPAASPDAAQEPAAAPTEAANAGEITYRITPGAAKAEFVIDEVLRGEPFTVVGTTDQVTGEVFLNAEDFSRSRLGVIRINARTLKTDSERRDGAIARLILKSADPANEFIEFRATALSGLPNLAVPGASHPVKIVGDLTVSGTTREVAFDGTAGLDGDGNLAGSAEAVIMYKDFNLSIPNVPFVAGVDDDLALKFSFTAARQQ